MLTTAQPPHAVSCDCAVLMFGPYQNIFSEIEEYMWSLDNYPVLYPLISSHNLFACDIQ